MMRMRRACVQVSLLTTVLTLLAVGAFASAELPYPPSLRPQVEFWKKIFAVYSAHQIAIHDTDHLDRVYSVLDYRERAAAGEDEILLDQIERDGIASEKERIRGILLRLDARQGNDGGLDEEERRIWNLFAGDNDPGRFAVAAAGERIRAQRGLQERFREGVRVSRRYLDEMEQIFRAEGMPVELTRLPLVESCFDLDAYSKVGAAGIWQFMPSTGRNYLHIAGVVDERRDPLRATRGAARHLAADYRALGSWPLAITAYNHGQAGMRRAVRETGSTDLGTIVRTYRGPLFGFASRNFYVEFLAAVEVEKDYRTHFGELRFESPVRGEEVVLDRLLAGRTAADCAQLEPEELAWFNPAVDRIVFQGRGNLPRGYLLRVPSGAASGFERCLARQGVADPRSLAAAGPTERTGASSPTYRTHRVAAGQTLSLIAQRYRVSVQRIKQANSMRGTVVRAGQVLRIPVGRG